MVGTSGAATKTATVESLTLCVRIAGPERGIVRYAGKHLKCKFGDKRIQVAGSGKQGVLGVSAESGSQGAKGTGVPGPEGKQGPEGKEGPQGPTGSAAARELRGGGASSTVENGMTDAFFGPSIDTRFSSETAIQETLQSAGTVSNLRVYLTGSAGSGDSYTFVVRRDPAGAAGPSDTGITCTVSGSSESDCTDTTHSQVFSAGDAISLVATENNNPTTQSMFFRLDVNP
jgi:hypothetical protein